MQKIIILKGCPASGKSTFCRETMKKEPGKWKRINNDDLRSAIDLGEYSPENEKMIRNLRNHMLKEFLQKNYNVLIDNVNGSSRAWDDVSKIAKEANKDIFLTEKPFYVELDEAIERDSKREGRAKVGEAVVRRWHKELGGKQFAFYHPKVETFYKRNSPADNIVPPMEQDDSLPRAVIFDNDGTISLLNGRNPYDASTCDEDLPHTHVVECMRLYFRAGYKILFVSGREEKDRAPTERFYKKHFPEVEYELHMRPTNNSEKDVVIKERIFNEHIKGKYFVAGWYDDRLQVSRWVFQSGLPLFRVNDPEATF
jgi:predicted kinase